MNTTCQARHFGPWVIELVWFREAIAAFNAGALQAKLPTEPPKVPDVDYSITPEGVAQFEISGQLMKGWSKFGGTNSVQLRRGIRAAANDPKVKGLMLAIDSPGGTVAGTEDLAGDLRMASARKPTVAHISDLGASAAYWVASQARQVYATPTSEVGSIGTMAVVPDTSEAAQKEGVKVHVVSTGAFKGVGIPGTPIGDKQLDYLQGRVDALNAHFIGAVARGRNVPMAKVSEDWGTGEVWIAEKAWSKGLIDGVKSYDEAYSALADTLTRETNRGNVERVRAETDRIAKQIKVEYLKLLTRELVGVR